MKVSDYGLSYSQNFLEKGSVFVLKDEDTWEEETHLFMQLLNFVRSLLWF